MTIERCPGLYCSRPWDRTILRTLRSRYVILRDDVKCWKRRKQGQNMGHGNGI